MLALPAMMLASCQKNTTDPNNPLPAWNSGCRLTSMQWDWDSVKMAAQYDAAGRLSRINDFDTSILKWFTTFEYQSDRVITRDSIPATSSYPAYLSMLTTYEIGSNDYASKSYFTNYPTVHDTTYYTYDNDGYCTQTIRRHYGKYSNGSFHLDYTETHDYTIAGGNRVKDSATYDGDLYNSDYKRVLRLEYYPEQREYVVNFHSSFDYPFLGKKNVSLVKTENDWHSGFGNSAPMTYSYSFDAAGKPVTVFVTNTGNNGTGEYYLGYECR
jgi:hypothetical protein